jgi:hypothetical protein
MSPPLPESPRGPMLCRMVEQTSRLAQFCDPVGLGHNARRGAA